MGLEKTVKKMHDEDQTTYMSAHSIDQTCPKLLTVIHSFKKCDKGIYALSFYLYLNKPKDWPNN